MPRVTCPNCAGSFRVGEEAAGCPVQCPDCSEFMLIPGERRARTNESGTETPTPAYAPATTVPVPQERSTVPVPQPARPTETRSASTPSTLGNWYLRIPSGRVYGPVSRRVLDRWFHERRIDQHCHVRQDGQAWQAASVVFPQLRGAWGRGEPGEKSRAWASFLAIFFGFFGAHRFYLGYTEIGTLMLFTLGGCGIWSTLDAILVVCGAVPDARGRRLR